MKDEGKRNSLIHRLKQTYRLILLKDITFREVGSMKITPLRGLFYILGAICLIVIVLILLLVYTPAKRLIPGYGQLESNKPYTELRDRVVDLEYELAVYRQYVNSFRTMFSDSLELVEDTEEEIYTPVEHRVVNRIPEDDSLRARVDINRDLLRMATSRTGSGNGDMDGTGTQYFFSPVNGLISNRFNKTKSHFGLDFIAPEDSPIKAIADGVVILSDNIMKTGYTIGIQHDNDLVTYYMHNSRLVKKKGDFVKAGEVIAIIGNTGELTSGPHLHFEMWYRGEALNPEKYLNVSQ